ncbi:hypothetical protein Sfulv_29730 [Streptomyces fulvorobeus]|uniref:MIP18 family-like domain-containing protein n=1 Tax=Streptomyces fulvorobeus TaxID=284028 RepID=A0A7J0C6N9_9ACTN|nr:hypothetical protein Sfulv_29730 [Streptomyces fulvorobeus]
MVTLTGLEAELYGLAGSVPDPELPVLTLEELGVIRGVRMDGPDSVTVRLTPTYTGCPAIEAMSADIERVLHDRGMRDVSVVTVLAPRGRRTTSATRGGASSRSSASHPRGPRAAPADRCP